MTLMKMEKNICICHFIFHHYKRVYQLFVDFLYRSNVYQPIQHIKKTQHAGIGFSYPILVLGKKYEFNRGSQFFGKCLCVFMHKRTSRHLYVYYVVDNDTSH